MSRLKKKFKKKNLRNYGFKVPTLTPDNYILGGLGISNKKVLNSNRNWLPYLPVGELQQRSIETQNCVAFGTLNALEILHRRLFLQEVNYSDRFLGIMADTNPYQGNDPHTVAEAIRKNGLVEEKSLPFENFTKPEDYYKPKPPTNNLIKEAKGWLRNYSFKHEYVFQHNLPLRKKQEKLLEALQYSPVGVSVRAWKRKGNLYVKEEGEQDNHWGIIVVGEKNKPWLALDSYTDDDFIKELDWNYPFGFAKLYSLETVKRSCFRSWLDSIMA